jgi:hypothetical protein
MKVTVLLSANTEASLPLTEAEAEEEAGQASASLALLARAELQERAVAAMAVAKASKDAYMAACTALINARQVSAAPPLELGPLLSCKHILLLRIPPHPHVYSGL